MDRNDIFNKVVEICKDVFENEDLVLTENTSATDVTEWDSLTHLSLVSDIEDEFDISFTLDEITNSKNLGDLVNALIKHMDEK